MTIARRLILLLLIPLLCLVGVTAVIVFESERLHIKTRELADVQIESLATIGRISRAINERRVSIRNCIVSQDPAECEHARTAFAGHDNELRTLFQNYSERLVTDAVDAKAMSSLREIVSKWDAVASSILSDLDSGHRDIAAHRLQTELVPLGDPMEKQTEAWTVLNEQIADKLGDELIATVETSRRNTIILTATGVIVAGLLGILVAGSIARPLRTLERTVEAIAAGNLTINVPLRDKRDEIGGLARSIDVLRTEAAAGEQQRWVKINAALIAGSLQSADSFEKFGQKLLSELAPLLAGGVSAFYLADAEQRTLRPLATFGLSAAAPSDSIRFGEGIVGQCAADQKRLTLNSLPPDYLRIATGLGSAPPRCAAAWPLCVQSTPVAVLELASFEEPSPRHNALLEELLPVVAISLDLLSQNLNTRRLLEETEAQAKVLSAKEEEFRSLLEAAPDALIISDPAGKVVLINAQTERLLGYTRQELVGQSIDILVPERFRARHPERRKSYHDNANVRPMGTGMELSAVRKDGSEFPVEISLSPLDRGDQGKFVCSSMRDITDRKKAEEALARASFMADMALDLTHAGYWHVDYSDPDYYYQSERAARIVGEEIKPDGRYHLQNEWFSRLVEASPEHASLTAERYQGAIEGRYKNYDAIYPYKRPCDDRIVWLHASGSLVRDEAGKARYMYGVYQDITEAKKLEDDLRLAKQKAEEATVAKSSFLANMSHEIRTPMNGIMGMTELALDTDLTAEQRDYLSTVKSSADALLSLINDILDFSKIEAGRIELDPVEFLMRDAMGDTLSPLALRASTKGVELAYDVHPDVPDAIIGDVYRLRQILVNLVGNAIKFTEKGEVVLAVKLVERRGDDLTLEFTVRDTGIGIAPAAAARLFKAFEQAESSTTRKYGGTGLGLAISKQLVELMGGQIKLESTPGVGSTFSFTTHMKAGIPRSAASAEDAARQFVGKCALLVDDNATNLRIVQTMLGHWGLRSILADSGKAALAALDRAASGGQPVSLVITDLHMPEMDGFDLVKAIRAHPAFGQLPIMLLTSSAATGDQARCADLGVAAKLLKPVKQSLLLDNIMRVLAGADRRGRSAAPSSRPASVGDEAAPAPLRPLKVLLAEDNPVNQKFAVRVLEGAGHGVTVANNGREAVDRSGAAAFDIILMDVQMPEMDGLDATRAIRAREGGANGAGGSAPIPIIAMTANAMTGDREMCLNAGMNGYVPKPVKREVLFAEIHRVLKEFGRAADV